MSFSAADISVRIQQNLGSLGFVLRVHFVESHKNEKQFEADSGGYYVSN